MGDKERESGNPQLSQAEFKRPGHRQLASRAATDLKGHPMQELAYWLLSLLFVIALILGLAVLVKKWVMPESGTKPFFRKGAKRRLSVVESLPLDHKSRLLLIRRDEKEHLILQSTAGETLIERGITPPSGTLAPPPETGGEAN